MLSRRRSTYSLFLAITLLSALPGGAQESAALQRALDPLEHGVPEASVAKLREQLVGEVAQEQALAVRLKLADALLAANRPAEAVEVLEQIPPLPEEGAAVERRELTLLQARAQALLGQWEKARVLFERYLDDPEAALGRAEALSALGKREEAIKVLEAIPEPALITQLRLAELYLESADLERCEALLAKMKPEGRAAEKWKQYLDARLLLAKGQPNLALGRFEDLQRDPRDTTPALFTGALLGVSDSRARLSGLSAADGVLEQFIWQHPDTPYLGDVFAKLDEIYTSEENPSDAELRKWIAAEHPLRGGYASYYAARLALHNGKRDRAQKFLSGFEDRYPQHPITAAALMLKGQLYAEEGEFAQAQTVLEAAMRAAGSDRERAEIEIASAAVSFRQGEYVLAATVFRAAGERSAEVWERAVFNSALSWLHQGNSPRFMEALGELTARAPESPYRHELLLEEGLLLARQGPEKTAEAEAALEKFTIDFPRNQRTPEAQLALAELAFARGDTEAAQKRLEAFAHLPERAAAPSAAVGAQADYLRIFVADAIEPRDDAAVIALAEAFLEKHPQAERRAEVRMKLGEVYSRVGNFAGAQSQFETLAKEEPDSLFTESALFLAAQASMQRMTDGAMERAMELFEEVARLNGSLKAQARLQQALAQNRLGKRSDAILIYDAILRNNPDAETRFAALAGKAENLAAQGESDPEARAQALELYTELAKEAALDPLWRTQALYRKGQILAAMKRPDDALAAYYDVLAEGLAKPQEYYWFYRAGFDAAQLCEARQQWAAAIAIYRKMAALDGPRAAEAEARVSQLRLEHFLWE